MDGSLAFGSGAFGSLVRSFLVISLSLALAGCGGPEDRGPTRRRLPAGYRLVQKGEYQALYGPNGRILRLLQNRNHDGRAEAVITYDATGKPERGEMDTNSDGVVDRWEYLYHDGTLEKVGFSRRGNGQPDVWEFPGPDGRVVRREIDEDGDGKPDRSELVK
jgi:hypothetical protein